jgi:hypothetical protein
MDSMRFVPRIQLGSRPARMNLQKPSDRRSLAEWAFLLSFYPALLLFYVAYKYPYWLLPAGADLSERMAKESP